MEYLAVAVAWPRFLDEPLREAKREALVEHVAPALDTLQADGVLAHWSHTFWGDDDLGTKVVRCVCGVGEAVADPATAGEQVRAAFADLGFEEGVEFRVEAPHDPDRFRRFWGDHLDEWLVVKAGLSSLAVAAIEEDLGESYAWHRRQNRPGHVWANQLGLTYMDEASVYQSLAIGYLDHVSETTVTEDQRTALAEVREHMEAAADLLPEG